MFKDREAKHVQKFNMFTGQPSFESARQTRIPVATQPNECCLTVLGTGTATEGQYITSSVSVADPYQRGNMALSYQVSLLSPNANSYSFQVGILFNDMVTEYVVNDTIVLDNTNDGIVYLPTRDTDGNISACGSMLVDTKAIDDLDRRSFVLFVVGIANAGDIDVNGTLSLSLYHDEARFFQPGK